MRQWWWIDLLAMGAVALLLLGAWAGAGAFGASEWVRTALLFSAIAAPPLMLYTFHRRVSYQVRDHRGIIVMVLVHILTYVSGVFAVVVTREISVLPFLAFAMAPAAGALVGIARISRVARAGPPPGLFGTFRSSITFTKWSFFGGLVGSLYTNGMNIIVAGVVGAAGSAAFAATRTMVAPIVSLTSATDMIDKPRAGRAFVARGLPGLRRSVLKTLATLVFLGAPYLMLVAAFSGEILELVYGPKYAGLETVLRLWALAMLLHMIANPLTTHLTTLGDTRSVFHCNLFGALVGLAVALPLLGQYGILAALVGMACGRLVNVVLLFCAIRRGRARQSVAQPAADERPRRRIGPFHWRASSARQRAS